MCLNITAFNGQQFMLVMFVLTFFSFITRFDKRDLILERNSCQVGVSVSKLGQVFLHLESLVVIYSAN